VIPQGFRGIGALERILAHDDVARARHAHAHADERELCAKGDRISFDHVHDADTVLDGE
jgi:hypothetical protein